MDLTRSAFHSPELWLMRSATLSVIRLGFCRLWSGQLNQSECSKGMSLPFPIHHLPSLKFGLSYLIKFLQNQEWWGLGTHSWTERWGKYLALKVLAKRDWGLWLILQNCFASIAWFMRLNFLKPKPPSFILAQFIPMYHMKLLNTLLMPPPKVSNDSIQFLAYSFRNFETGKSIEA